MRGEIVTIGLPGAYGKPRPALVIQSDLFNALGSVTVLPVTSEREVCEDWTESVRYVAGVDWHLFYSLPAPGPGHREPSGGGIATSGRAHAASLQNETINQSETRHFLTYTPP
jgi:hypothetical protein